MFLQVHAGHGERGRGLSRCHTWASACHTGGRCIQSHGSSSRLDNCLLGHVGCKCARPCPVLHIVSLSGPLLLHFRDEVGDGVAEAWATSMQNRRQQAQAAAAQHLVHLTGQPGAAGGASSAALAPVVPPFVAPPAPVISLRPSEHGALVAAPAAAGTRRGAAQGVATRR